MEVKIHFNSRIYLVHLYSRIYHKESVGEKWNVYNSWKVSYFIKQYSKVNKIMPLNCNANRNCFIKNSSVAIFSIIHSHLLENKSKSYLLADGPPSDI